LLDVIDFSRIEKSVAKKDKVDSLSLRTTTLVSSPSGDVKKEATWLCKSEKLCKVLAGFDVTGRWTKGRRGGIQSKVAREWARGKLGRGTGQTSGVVFARRVIRRETLTPSFVVVRRGVELLGRETGSSRSKRVKS